MNAALSGLSGKKRANECQISQKHTGKAFDLRVTATPYKISKQSFVIFIASDISHEKRRSVLEKTFFHDISNTLTGVVGFTNLLQVSDVSMQKYLLEKLSISVNRLQEEINSQRGLVSAECGDLSVNLDSVRSRDFLLEIISFYKKDALSLASLQIEIDKSSIDIMLISDKILLSRVFGNMLKTH